MWKIKNLTILEVRRGRGGISRPLVLGFDPIDVMTVLEESTKNREATYRKHLPFCFNIRVFRLGTFKNRAGISRPRGVVLASAALLEVRVVCVCVCLFLSQTLCVSCVCMCVSE